MESGAAAVLANRPIRCAAIRGNEEPERVGIAAALLS